MIGKIKDLNSGNFDSFVRKGESIVDFYADWCGPCKKMEPEFEKASEEIKEAKFGRVNVDGNQEIAQELGVMSIPTVIFFKNKKVVDKHVGAMSFKDIKKNVGKVF